MAITGEQPAPWGLCSHGLEACSQLILWKLSLKLANTTKEREHSSFCIGWHLWKVSLRDTGASLWINGVWTSSFRPCTLGPQHNCACGDALKAKGPSLCYMHSPSLYLLFWKLESSPCLMQVDEMVISLSLHWKAKNSNLRLCSSHPAAFRSSQAVLVLVRQRRRISASAKGGRYCFPLWISQEGNLLKEVFFCSYSENKV